MNFDYLTVSDSKQEVDVCVVRITTNYWSDTKGLYSKKSIRFLRRKCKGFNILEEDISQIGADWVIKDIENLDRVEDGIYKVVTTNVTRDWESGHIEGYDYRLVKYREDTH